MAKRCKKCSAPTVGEAGDYRGVIEDYNQAIRRQPGFLYFGGWGYMRYALGDYRGALADYDEMIRTYGFFALQSAYNIGD